MIKISKPYRHANIIKVTNEAIKNGILTDNFKSNLSKLKFVPKNTLRANFLRFDIGEMKEDFVRDMKSMISVFEIIRFKRK